MISDSKRYQGRDCQISLISLYLLVVLFALTTVCHAQDKGNSAVFRALLIGNSDYGSEKWPDLLTAVADVRALATVLKSDYGFAARDIIVLKNGDKQQILKGFYQLEEAAGQA
ncbi:MAG: caspase family protein [SAR324 cluster bacterium]|nr:caspase family protein [SAR324 cluster bacterium]